MAYDLNGNILSKKETTFTLGNSTISSYTTKSYEVPTTSSASDILTKYNGQTVTTTNPGNITAIGSVTYSWTRQQFLSQVYKSASDYSTYSYAGNGVRTKKIHYQNGTAVTHTYVTSKGRILKETITGGSYAGVIDYLYLGNSVIGFTYNDSKYIFKKNLQYDIIGIYDEGDNLVASYVYDAWGNHKVYGSNGVENTSTTFIGNINPFRYRSYYYDRESKLYYCKARYYNPELCRWMSLDSIEYLEEDRINGCNLYAYCMNDPVNYFDSIGKKALHVVILLNLLSVFSFSINYENVILDGRNFSFEKNDYSIFNSMQYAKYIKETIYFDNRRRSERGINLELILHYIAYKLPFKKLKEHGEPAYIGDIIENGDDTAAFCETLVGNGIVYGEYEFLPNDYSNLVGYNGFLDKIKSWLKSKFSK